MAAVQSLTITDTMGDSLTITLATGDAPHAATIVAGAGEVQLTVDLTYADLEALATFAAAALAGEPERPPTPVLPEGAWEGRL